MTRHELGETIFERLKARYDAKQQLIGDAQMRFHERMIMLSVIDGLWKDHLLNMDHLKEGIGLRGYAQQDPLVAYKKESFEMFEAMMARFQEDTVRFLFLMKIVGPDGQPVEIPTRPRPAIPAAPHVASADGNGHREPNAPPIPLPSDARAVDDDRRSGEGVPAQEAEGAGARADGGRRRRFDSGSSGARAKRLGGTILAPAGRGRSTRSATARKARAQGSGYRKAQGTMILRLSCFGMNLEPLPYTHVAMQFWFARGSEIPGAAAAGDAGGARHFVQ